jgi:Flp pilus assembly protein protease CpaA
MLIVGMFFFWVAVMSGLFGIADAFSAHLHLLHIVFYSSLLIATLMFALRLLRARDLDDAPHEEPAAEAAPGAMMAPEPIPAEVASGACGRELVIAGPLVAGMR